QAEDGIRDRNVTGLQTCALPISTASDYGTPPGAPCSWGWAVATHRPLPVGEAPTRRWGPLPGVDRPVPHARHPASATSTHGYGCTTSRTHTRRPRRATSSAQR